MVLSKVSYFFQGAARECSPREEMGNAITHGVGVVLSILALVAMVIHGSGTGITDTKSISVLVYGLSLVVLYLASTLYHLAKDAKKKRYFNLLDNLAIFILIAGTYTPIALNVLEPKWGIPLCIGIWVMAAAGIIFKIFFLDRYRFISTLIYLAMGWVFLMILRPLWDTAPYELIQWIFIGGFFYSIGTFFYLWKKIPFGHTIWHIFVLLGSASHFAGICCHIVI